MENENKSSEKNMNQEAEEVTEEISAESTDTAEEVIRLKDQLLRTMAELENTRKRAEREKDDVRKYAISGFCKDFLIVLDTLDRALESVPEAEKQSDLLKNLCEGIGLTQNEASKAFAKHEVKKLNPKGEKFDPNFHQAVVEVPTDAYEPGHVVDVLQVGYVIGDRLLRPAMVTVSKKKE
ncbi:MAG: nucleotide exchange factor GrpE [Alphaproteobacteria bacterium RIFCSPLOWO2_01_FULL_45_8]|nr:MAG: nucleotide exchange factor GrpE [Alphaproteobacteria bacterium GWB1_45_5]OFW76382.1 MAG: nucleotide exchange factor GrpE [Alphaproteobacteria bacterium GWA1_45_9]OFW89343.1 MAG: nucleotide exchange factor GrpE [Alphaproteobacteria bacterium RIFCSPHIGHO2_01_FULL_41_14]OFW95722.1 MAG: nucleotide exchange factor GrpE [Alphaproteobacteria bacterium RIFCSPLOWO2_01_FULL_45_8]HCI48321.1 nucleotide exchange factor GrpE [Holosporales bacterium]